MTQDPPIAPLARVGILSVAHCGVPPAELGSVAYVVDQISRRLVGSYEVSVVSGTWARDPGSEAPDVVYRPLGTRFDRLLGDPLEGLRERLAGLDRHRFHRREYHTGYARRAARFFAEQSCEVVLVNVFPQWLKWVRSALPDATLLLWSHDATFAESGVGGEQDLEPADGVVACSEFVARQYEARAPRLKGRCHALHNGVDLEVFHPPVRGGESPPPIVTYAGRITPEKGVHRLVQAFRDLSGRHPDLELHLCGPLALTDPRVLRGTDPTFLPEVAALAGGDYAAELRERAGGAAQRLHFRGKLSRPELAELFRRSTVVVHPALWEEPFGMPILEAMACGTPVVVTRRGGVPEFVEDGHSGWLIEAGDDPALVASIEQALADSGLRDKMGKAAAEHAAASFSWDAVASRLTDILAGPGSPTPTSSASSSA